MLDNFWILLLFPLIGAAVNGILGKRFKPPLIAAIGCLTVFTSFGIALLSFFELLGLNPESRAVTNHLFTWIEAGDFVAEASFLFDPLSAVMILVVTGVGFLIHVYSVGYMQGETGYYRFFAYMNLFIFMMSILVLADNYLLMFVGWEGVGLCSYLLIGYYFETRVAGDAAKKAFIVNRIGDFGFLLGMFLIFQNFGTLEYHSVFAAVADKFPVPEAGIGVLSAITLLMFLGATGKSAQIPLYVWLPDAMAGPTPVSALIHAATMVTAGVYMIARSSTLYSRAPETMLIVACVGIFTALVAALIAFAQRDIKKVLAYSTVSQLGYMFLAVGVGAFATGVFHLYTHAFFKALLFLGSGSVILALHHEQDMAKMGGLKKYLPITWATMGIATLAIAGIPPFAGFFSKDEILWRSFAGGHLLLWIVGVMVAAMTAFYMARLMFMTFYGKERFSTHGHENNHHSDNHGSSHPPKDPSRFVTTPLVILAVLSVIGGLVGPPAWIWSHNYWEEFLEPVFHYTYTGEHHSAHSYSLEIGLAAMVIALAVGSMYLAYRILVSKPEIGDRLVARFPGVHKVLENKFYLDEIYDAVIVWPIERLSRGFLWKFVDVSIIDGAVNGVASVVVSWGQRLRKIQSGYARVYASWILLGAVVIFLYYFFTS